MTARRMAPVDEQMAVLMRGTDFGDDGTRRTMERELRARLAEDRPLRIYCGYDPTSVDLHLGHTISMRKLRQFQQFGHEVTFLIGNFTGLIGDPSDRDRRRPMVSAETLAGNAATYAEQAGRILDMGRVQVRYNAEWLGKLTFADVIQLCAHFTVAEFLKRDNFARRMERDEPVYISEFLYGLMQAYDAVALQADVQVGGTEQLFNLMAGRKLQEESGQQPQIVITLPLLVGTDGHEKMSKSLGNYIGVDDEANDVFGKVMSLPDSAMENYFTLLTSVPAGEAQSLLEAVAAGRTPPIEAKKQLALEVTASMYPRPQAEAAQAYFEATFQRRETPDEMQEYAVQAPSERLDQVLVGAKLAASMGEVRRLVTQGGIRVNDEAVTSATIELRPGDEVRVGRTRFLRVVAGKPS
jgi:tyrosyl-tRNA synthetase